MKHHQHLYIHFSGNIIFLTVLLLFSVIPKSHSQTLAELEMELAELEAQLDSVSILGFVDSLIQLAEPKSSISLNTGYASQVFTNGQDLGLQQFGLNSSFNYYHKSGFHGNINSFYNSEIDPKLYLNIVGIGYMNSIGSHFNYNVGYEKSYFGEAGDNSLTNSLYTSFSYVNKSFFTNVTYAFLFDDESAHQIIPSITYQKSITNVPIVKRIDISPTINFFWASPNAITANFSENLLKELWLTNQLPPEKLEQLLDAPRLSNFIYSRLSTSFSVKKNRSITLLNKSLSIPINFQLTDKLSFSFAYSYIFSEKLFLGKISRNEESIDELRRSLRRIDSALEMLDTDIIFENLDNSAFINVSLSYFFEFK